MIDPKSFQDEYEKMRSRFCGQMPPEFGSICSFDPSAMVQGNPLFKQWLTMQKRMLENWDRMLENLENSNSLNPLGPIFDALLTPFQQMTGMSDMCQPGTTVSKSLIATQRKVLQSMLRMVEKALGEEPVEEPA